MDLIKKYILLVPIAILLITNVATIYYFTNNPKEEEKIVYECNDNSNENEGNSIKTFNVDIKGYIKKPGVYKITEGATVNDLINMAGGLLKNGSTKNLNLSKKLIDEALVVVSSKYSSNTSSCVCENVNSSNKEEVKSFAENDSNYAEAEIKNKDTTNNNANNNNNLNTKININTASLNELTNIPSIGEAKAQKIIEYRIGKKFKTIEDIKEVSGIGDALFEKIKEYITV